MIDIVRVVLKIAMWILILGFGCNAILQTISYSFYKNAQKFKDVTCSPYFLQMTDTLTGYGYHLEEKSNKVILFFGGSNYIAYNTVGKFADQFEEPFIAVDYYGTQESSGKLNVHTMKRSAEECYDWIKEKYPQKDIVIMGHSYGVGIATYLASVRECKCLYIAAGYRDLSDLYNKMVPIFWGPFKIFISNNIQTSEYAKSVECPVYLLGSKTDTTLNDVLQVKLSENFDNAAVKIFADIRHEDYFVSQEVEEYIKSTPSWR